MRLPHLLALFASTLLGFTVLGACSPDQDTGSGGSSSQAAGSGGSATNASSANGNTSSGNTTSNASSGSGTGGSTASYNCSNPDPAWLLCDDFEGMANGYDAWRMSWSWTDHIGADDPGRMTSSTDAHDGGFSLYMPADA